MSFTLGDILNAIGVLIALAGLWGVIEWRASQKRDAIFKKLDALREDVKSDYVRKDIHNVTQNQQDVRITDLKKEIDEIKVKTEMIPQIMSDVKSILFKLTEKK